MIQGQPLAAHGFKRISFFVMLAYNLMNLFKEYVLGQKDKKRMWKWIRQRFFLIARKLIKSGRKFILKP